VVEYCPTCTKSDDFCSITLIGITTGCKFKTAVAANVNIIFGHIAVEKQDLYTKFGLENNRAYIISKCKNKDFCCFICVM